jgi:hypothetical protein
LAGVVFSPKATYADVAAQARWFGALATIVVIAMIATAVFFSTEVGQRAMLDQQVKTMQSFGIKMTDAQVQRMEASAGRAPYFSAAGQLVTLPFFALIISGLTFAIFNAALGGDAKFKQVYAVVAHSGIIIALQQLFVLPLDYVKESLSSPATLAVFLPMLDENTFLAQMLGSIDLFVIWWAVNLSIGLAVLYRRKTGPVATSLLVVYLVIALVIAGVKTAVSGA